jgi:hypothetical protein
MSSRLLSLGTVEGGGTIAVREALALGLHTIGPRWTGAPGG